MKNYFVTLFDSHYLSRGLILYESLKGVADNFHLFILAIDEICFEKLSRLNLEETTIISMKDFEDEELKRIKEERLRSEFCWSCTAKSILYVLKKYNVPSCTYIDSDLCFFEDPQILLDEMDESKNVMITEHRYTTEYDQEDVSGKYCVQFMNFKNNEEGHRVLQWWSDRCIEWCYAIPEEGKCGDQKYLDDWVKRFHGVHELQHLGGGVAPWNVQQYSFKSINKQIYLSCIEDSKQFPLVFYHFHKLVFFDKDVVKLTSAFYQIPDTAISFIYKKYVRLSDYVCNKYELWESSNVWRNEEIYKSDINKLKHEHHYYNYSLFL